MAKKILKQLKIQATGGAATPAPPLAPVLGQAGVNIGELVKRFNDATQERKGELVCPVVCVIEEIILTEKQTSAPPPHLVRKAGVKDKGSGKNLVSKVGPLPK